MPHAPTPTLQLIPGFLVFSFKLFPGVAPQECDVLGTCGDLANLRYRRKSPNPQGGPTTTKYSPSIQHLHHPNKLITNQYLANIQWLCWVSRYDIKWSQYKVRFFLFIRLKIELSDTFYPGSSELGLMLRLRLFRLEFLRLGLQFFSFFRLGLYSPDSEHA